MAEFGKPGSRLSVPFPPDVTAQVRCCAALLPLAGWRWDGRGRRIRLACLPPLPAWAPTRPLLLPPP